MERKEIAEIFNKLREYTFATRSSNGFTDALDEALEMLNDPDFTYVVRCNKCRWEGDMKHCIHIGMQGENFCSEGSFKTEFIPDPEIRRIYEEAEAEAE